MQSPFTRLMLAALLVGAIGCSQKTVSESNPVQAVAVTLGVSPTAISSIKTSDRNASLHLKGRVINRAPLLDATMYELQDATGRVWVRATGAAPEVGDEVVIKGTLQFQSIRLNNQEQGAVYIEQQEQLQRTPPTKS